MFRNFALIKLFFALLTSYLLYEELFTFWIEKPTYTSSSKVKIGPQDFPDITICPFPSWNQQELVELGYAQSFEYSKGKLDESTMFGWSGNSTGISPENVFDKISILKNQTECPFTRVMMRSEGREIFNEVKFKLTSLYHPSGRCCKVKYKMLEQRSPQTSFKAIVPKESESMIIGGLTFRIYPLTKNLPLVEGYQILLSDRDSENIFHKDRFNLDGVELKTSIKEPGYKLYDLKIYKEIYLEDHDNFRCRNYANFGDYNSVRKSGKLHY